MSSPVGLTGSERSGGIFGERKFTMTSALSANKTPTEPKTTDTIQKSPRRRTQRTVSDHGMSKAELIERTLKSIDLASSKNSDKFGSSHRAFDPSKLHESASSLSKMMGDNLSRKGSSESIGTDIFTMALEMPLMPDELCRNDSKFESTQSLLQQIESLTQITSKNEGDCKKVQTLVSQLNDEIIASERSYKSQIKDMKRAQDSSFADLFYDKNEEIKKLQSEIEELKSSLRVANAPAFSEAVQMARDEMEHYGKKLRQKNDDIKKLMNKLAEAKACIDSLEKEKSSTKLVNPCVDSIKEHFKIIRKALQSNKKMVQMMQTEKHSSDSKIAKEFE